MNTNNASSRTIPKAVVILPHERSPTSIANFASTNSIISCSNVKKKDLNTRQIKELLSQGYTEGLVKSLTANMTLFPLRFWIIDNSGTMLNMDGHRYVLNTHKECIQYEEQRCSRWEEMKDTVEYHVNLAALLEIPTTFTFLNHPGAHVGDQHFTIATNGYDNIPSEVNKAFEILSKVRPSGVTCLTTHIMQIRKTITNVKQQLEDTGQKAVVIIATDGLPTDSHGNTSKNISDNFIDSLRRLQDLPVWLVIRLCTDETDVVEFYNTLDEQLELSIDVIDDFHGESAEVKKFNNWLNYSLPLHRLRELGFHDRLLDLLDERSLTKSELREFLFLLFGEDNFDSVPDPSVDWKKFVISISKLLESSNLSWNVSKKKMKPIISLKKLNHQYGDGLIARLCK